MATQIGRNYLGNLEKIKHFIIAIRSGSWQENLEVVIDEVKSGKCYYDRCSDKHGCDKGVYVITSDRKGVKSISSVFMHSYCIDELLSDQRFDLSN